MPEGDTVHLAAARLHEALAGATLTRTELRVPRYATVDLSGRVVDEVDAWGKHLFARIEGGVTLHTHLKMEGEWHLYRPRERWRAPAWQARAVLETPSWVAVGFRLGITELIATAREGDITAALGPDPLRPEWDPERVLTALRAAPERALGEALLDQRVIAGIGNVYKSEICFLSGIEPRTPIGDVPDLDKVVDLAKRLLEANRATGMQITTGDTRPGRRHWVYGRRGRPCVRCGTAIERDEQPSYGSPRVTYRCPACQVLRGALSPGSR